MAKQEGEDRRERAARWHGHLSAWKASGLSQSEYCRRQGLKPADFSWWKYELARRAAQPNPAQPKFIPITAIRIEASASPGGDAGVSFEIVLRNGRIVRTGADFDASALARLLSLAEQSC